MVIRSSPEVRVSSPGVLSRSGKGRVEKTWQISAALFIKTLRLHQTTQDLEIVFAADPKNGLEDAVLHSFEDVTEEIIRRTDKIAGVEKNVR